MSRFLVVESLLLASLLSLAGYVFWESPGADTLKGDQLQAQELGGLGIPPFVTVVAGICCLLVVLYWLFQWLRMTTLSFWMVTLAVLLPQMPTVFAHNHLDWVSLLGGPTSSTELSQVTVGALFLMSLALLATLLRVSELRRLAGRLRTLRLDSGEQGTFIGSEILTLVGLVGFSLFVTAVLVTVAATLTRFSNLLVQSPWTVLTIGATALIMVTVFLHLWLRTRREN